MKSAPPTVLPPFHRLIPLLRLLVVGVSTITTLPSLDSALTGLYAGLAPNCSGQLIATDGGGEAWSFRDLRVASRSCIWF